jgi:hypothetical protein
MTEIWVTWWEQELSVIPQNIGYWIKLCLSQT